MNQEDKQPILNTRESLAVTDPSSSYFEEKYLLFVQRKGHASCFELMKEFFISYANAVHIMDVLEERGIVDIDDSEEQQKGPRPLMTEARRKKREQQKKDKVEKERRTREEEEKREQEKKPEPAPVVKHPVPEVRKRTQRRAKH